MNVRATRVTTLVLPQPLHRSSVALLLQPMIAKGLNEEISKTPCETKQLFPHSRASDVPPPVIATCPVPATHFAPCHCPQATRIHKAYPAASSGLDVSARSLRNETVLESLVGEERYCRRRLGWIELTGERAV